MSKQDRNIALESYNILDSFMKEGTQPIDEGIVPKKNLVDLSEVEEFLKDKEMSYYALRERTPVRGEVRVSILFVSNKNVTISNNANLLEFGIRIDKNWDDEIDITVREGDNISTNLEEFAKHVKTSHGKDVIAAKDVIKMCDCSQIYNIYQDVAWSIMRRMFSYAYHMFTGTNMYRMENKRIPTLQVSYNPIRKKFLYEYNPEFILQCAIDEWTLNGAKYNSLSDCYTYILAFVITHEMLHIIHHNTDVGGEGDSMVPSCNHHVANMIQDSFINCKISGRYRGLSGLTNSNETAPVPRLGIGSEIIVRSEHNAGFNKFETNEELGLKIAKILSKALQYDGEAKFYSSQRDISMYAGADSYISIDISPTFTPLRSGSNVFQRVINDIIELLTKGVVRGKTEDLSDDEKLTDLQPIPNGTLVLVKGVRDVVYIENYDEASGLYSLAKSKVEGVDKIPQGGGVFMCITKYAPTEDKYGFKRRTQIKPYNPADDAYLEGTAQEKEDKLSQEDIQKAQGMPSAAPPQQSDSGGSEPQMKVLNVGDVVWVRKLKKFGRITLIKDGKFSIEEVVEKPAKVIDDSENYN